MSNLLEETIEILSKHGKTPNDVIWVGDATAYFTWQYFEEMANREYDNGFGEAEVLTNLLVVGNSWWLERHEYDGSEGWEYKTLPAKPLKMYKVPSVFYKDYVWYPYTILEIQDREGEK